MSLCVDEVRVKELSAHMCHVNLFGFALSQSKVLARTMSAHFDKSFPENRECVMELLDPIKSMNSERLVDKVTELVLLLDHAGCAIDGGATNIKGIRSNLSTTRTNKDNKGNLRD